MWTLVLLTPSALVAIWAAAVWIMIALVPSPAEHERRMEHVLADRFAVGELDEQEFLRRLHTLRTAPATRSLR